jgi:hypothetical protein
MKVDVKIPRRHILRLGSILNESYSFQFNAASSESLGVQDERTCFRRELVLKITNYLLIGKMM